MITIHASAVCHVLDGYTGRPVEASALLCDLDGVPVRPLGKPGGYLVLLDLAPGSHRLALRSHGYQEEWVDFRAGEGTQELEITMKPGAGYPFRGKVVRLDLTVTEQGAPAAGRRLWLAAPPAGWELKVAQTKAEAGVTEFRMYCKGSETAVPSGAYLIADGAESEIVYLRRLEGEMGYLNAPLRRDHGRSRPLLPAQCYHTGPDGRLAAVLRDPCTLEVYGEEEGLLASLPLEHGENIQNLQL